VPRRSLILVCLLAAACGSSSAPPPKAAPVDPSPVTLSPEPTPSPPASAPPARATRAAVRAVNPLTGLKPTKASPVVIKVDNVSTAWPYQRGIGHAAVVYEELVESGQTRLAAVYDGSWSGEVGPIRSARETDIELLPQLGRPTVAFSGANKGVMRSVARAAHRGLLVDAAQETYPGLFREGVRRRDAYNFFSTPGRLRAARPGSPAKDIGFNFARLPKGGAGRAALAATIRFSDFARVVVRYNKRTGRYAVYQDGHAMPGVAPANVIVQRVSVRGSRYVDVLGSRTPYSTTTGHGAAVLLRDGRLIRASWRRLTVRTGTRFLDDKGRDVPMKPGPTWVLLQPSGERFSWSA
jgi:hypothetical protein